MDGQCKRRFLWCIWWQGKASLIRWQWSRDFKKRKRSKSHGFLWGQHSRHFSAVQFSHSVVLDFLWPHGLQHTKPPCSSPTPEACSNSRPLSRWCHPTISSYVVSFSSCLQSFPESGSLPMASSSHQVAKVLEIQLKLQSFQWIFRTDFL